MRSHYFYRCFKQCLYFWLAATAIQFSGRILLFLLFTNHSLRQQYSSDIPALFLQGLRFDIQSAAYLTAVAFLISLFALPFQGLLRYYQAFITLLIACLLSLTLILTVSNIFYFQTYDKQFDVFVFGLFEEDTLAILTTIWNDYPVIWGSLGLAIATYLLKLSLDYVGNSRNLPRGKTLIALALSLFIFLALGMRGSLGKFPLRQAASQISSAQQINRLVPNALIALKWAYQAHQNSQQFQPASLAKGAELIQQLTGQTVQTANLELFYRRTAANPAVEKRPPNVVLAIMESMSAHLLQLHQPERDFLGRLASHWQNDWVYPYFVSEGDGTSDSLHRLFIRSPYLNLSQSSAKEKAFPNHLFAPYLAAGYRVIYITAGNGGWRDFDNFLRHLGVHEVIDENALKAHYPEAQSSAWGVPDEFMFRYANERLAAAEQSGEPIFIMMLSITNHPPYRLPETQQMIDYALSVEEAKRFNNLSQGTQLNEVLNTFRYANDALGAFISEAKNSAPHSIIAATGDHNMRAINYPDPTEGALAHAVPFYLYVPEIYRQQARYEASRVGSHKDIMPTLYALSLSQAPYLQYGCDLSAAEINDIFCGYGYNHEVILFPEGFYQLNTQQFYAWEDHQRRDLKAKTTSDLPNDLAARIQQARLYPQWLNWQIDYLISGTKP